MHLDWQFKPYKELTLNEFHDIIALRLKAFVVEQNCAYQDADEWDAVSWHLFALDEKGHALATCRLIPAGQRYAEAAIGRVANAPGVRGRGMGRALMQEALQQLAQRSPGPVRISAQQYLQGFYENLGFAATSAVYLEDGIPHLDMLKK